MNAQTLPLADVTRRTARLVAGMMAFWKSAQGWAPVEAASLLTKSMLEWQSSLAACLDRWIEPLTDGELILAWANVGALVEGQLKLFLSVYHKDYSASIGAIKSKAGAVVDPDGLSIEPLRVFFKNNIWASSDPWDSWISLVQERRNAIHAFKFRPIGTSDELHESLRTLLSFVREINSRLPYPDDIYVPHER